MVTESQILSTFDKFFQNAQRLIDRKMTHVDDNGLLNVMGDVVVKMEWTSNQGVGLPEGKIPVAFGTVSGTFSVARTNLRSLEGAPSSIGNICWIGFNPLTSLEGGPQHIHHLLIMDELPLLSSLDGFPPQCNTCRFTWTENLPLLRLLQAKKLILDLNQQSMLPNSNPKRCFEILKRYEGQGEAGAFACGAELATAGYKENARW
jgi:hypothetical protein